MLNSDKLTKCSYFAGAFACGAFATYTLLNNETKVQQPKPTPQSQKNETQFSITESNKLHAPAQPKNKRSKQNKQVRIYLDGCWDVMHSGHYNAIRQAKALGDVLVVGVHSDKEISIHKREPIMKNEERLAAVRACKWVDEVIFDAPYVPSLELLNKINCDFVAHGDDIPYAANGESAYVDVMHRLKIFRRTRGVSTTHLIQRLLRATTSLKKKKKKKVAIKHYVSSDEVMQTDSSSPTHSFSELNESEEEDPVDNEKEMNVASWSSFLASSTRISAFSNHRVPLKSDKVIYIDGIFDLFHIGHISALKAAKQLGTFLYVGLYDDSIIRLQKGKHFPLMGIQERVLNVLSCKYVDEVIIGCPLVLTQDTISSLNIAYVVSSKVTKFDTHEGVDRYSAAKALGIYKEIVPESTFTTEDLMIRSKAYYHSIAKQNEKKMVAAKKYQQQSHQYVPET